MTHLSAESKNTMIARRKIPPEYEGWNKLWGAPFGRPGFRWPLCGTRFDVRHRGPFAWQGNNTTREYEYPWAHEQIANNGSKQTIIDVGGSLGGMQFVLAQEGHSVITVDPGLKATGLGWEVDSVTHAWLCRRLGADVQIISETLAQAKLASASTDTILCISSLEHFSDRDLASTANDIQRILKKDGLVVMTVDCFVDLAPFTTKEKNEWGRNISIHDFLQSAGLVLESGDPAELVGFPDFKTEQILQKLPIYNVGQRFPCLAQCFTARKRK